MEQKNPQVAAQSPLRILLAEDIPTNQKIALNMLGQLGYCADVVSNGLEVLAALHRQSYDVILIDVQMPEMNGLEATRKIRQIDRGYPWIIAMTAHAMQDDRELCLQTGMNDYISKPIRMETLTQALEKLRQSKESVKQPLELTQKRDRPLATITADTITSEAAIAEAPLPVLDIKMILELRKMWGQNADELLIDLFRAYLEDAPQRCAKIQDAIFAEDMQALTYAAHAMKSLSAAIGAIRLVKLCETLEIYGRENKLDSIPIALAQLFEQCEQCEQVATAFLGGLGVSPV
jgi:CheY-like chemotaxis protein/HPt (histidine-containing phosphotransfer) domain-containing protein